jgi:hypothetical protein
MVTKRTRSALRGNPTHSEAVALIQNSVQGLAETNRSHAHQQLEERMPDEYEFAYSAGVYDSDEDASTQDQTSTSASIPIALGKSVTEMPEPIPIASGNAVATSLPIVLGNSATTIIPIASGSSVTGTIPIVSGNLVRTVPINTQAAATLAAIERSAGILQMGNVVINDPPIPKRSANIILSTTLDML